jgi:hypothetical protein
VAGFQVDERTQVIASAILVEYVSLSGFGWAPHLFLPNTSRFILPAF